MRCATPIRVSGAVLDAEPAIRVERIVGQMWADSLCCEPCPEHVRITTTVLAVTRQVEGPGTLGALGMSPPVVTPTTLRHCPFLKVRVSQCGRSDPAWLDSGQTVHVPREAAVSLLAPVGWITSPAEGQTIPPPTPGASYTAWDVWLLAELACSPCCPDGEPWTLTDSLLIPTGDTDFVVPPQARCVTIHRGLVGVEPALDLQWVAPPLVVGTSSLPAGAPAAFSTGVPDVPILRVVNTSGTTDHLIVIWSR